jgi:DNA-directed RNA polymerase subunit alpha
MRFEKHSQRKRKVEGKQKIPPMKTPLVEKNPFFLACKESRVESPVSLYGCFYLGPFHSGQSLTVANALRRTLLSELTGIAITSVQIDGAMHEYSTLNGVRESVLDILLNLKEVVLKIQTGSGFSNTESTLFRHPNVGYLKARGPGIVRARDLKLPASIQCVNPDQYLLTLCEDGSIDLKFRIYRGKNSILQNRLLTKKKTNFPVKSLALKDLNPTNLSLSQTNSSLSSLQLSEWKPKPHLWKKQFDNKVLEKSSIPKKSQFVKKANFMSIDSIFSPVNQVNYIIEENSPSNHLIILEIWTNGSISPKQALFCGVTALIKLFSRLETFRILDSSLIETIFRTNQPENKMSLGSSYFSEPENSVKEAKSIKSQPNMKNDLNTPPDLFQSSNQKSSIGVKINRIKNDLLDIGTLNISLRAYTCLKRARIDTIGQLIKCTGPELLKIRNFGKRSLEEVKKSLQQINLTLKVK